MKVLPELLKSVEFGNGGPKAFGIVMKIATKLSQEDFDSKMTPVLIRLFGNPDRVIRVSLLDNLPLMIDRLSQKVVNDKIFPQIVSGDIFTELFVPFFLNRVINQLQVTGFTDVAPVVREQTLKSVLTLITKLSDRTINGELLRYLAKTANDEQPGIRTNTTICLGKIAKHLGPSSRAKVLMAAFTRSLRDPFVHARNAALMALSVTSEYFSEEDCAARILPAVCPLLIDKEKLIRDQASKTVDVYLAKIKKAAAGMPATALPPDSAAAATGGPRMSTPQPAESAAASWAGWAISSFTNKLSAVAGEIQSSSSPVNGPAASTPSTGAKRPAAAPPRTQSVSPLPSSHRQAVKSPPPSAPPTSNKTSFFQVESSAHGDDDNTYDDAADAWGDMDDMVEDDENGDQGESAADLFSANGSKSPSTTTTTTTTSAATTTTNISKASTAKPAAASAVSAKPFDDGSEPDFAGWLAAQAQKKKAGGLVGGKALPKGLTKKTATPASATKPKSPAPAPAKKIDMKPKQTDDDDNDAWGGW